MRWLQSKRLRYIAGCLFVLFVIMLAGAMCELSSASDQYDEYAVGRQAYLVADYQNAATHFDRSFQSYRKPNRIEAIVVRPSSIVLAQLALDFKGLALTKSGDREAGKIALKLALALTTDYALARLSLDQQTLAKVTADRGVIQAQLVILERNKPDSGDDPGKEGSRAPGDPQNQPEGSAGKPQPDSKL
jgi:hypothetical protein